MTADNISPTIIPADAVVVGAGPAGATFALNLAPFRRVLLVDKLQEPVTRIGESLAAASRRLLTDMGLWDSFRAEGHSPCYGGQSLWGSPDPVDADHLRDMDGHGWHLDRRKFNHWLRTVATARGAALLAPAVPMQVTRIKDDGWCVDLALGERAIQVQTRLLVDAGGRGSPLAKHLGAKRHVTDKLVCRYVHGTDAQTRQSGITHIEAEQEGWWYTAPLPDNRRVLAFHTDADLPAAQELHDTKSMMQRAERSTLIASVLKQTKFQPQPDTGFCAAHSSTLQPGFGDGWLAVGDAAMSFDPLSSQGLFNSLYSGLAGAEAADRYLSEDHSALASYGESLQSINTAYQQHLQAWYGLERRWSDSPFWQRRHAFKARLIPRLEDADASSP